MVRIWVRLNQSVTLIALIVALGAFAITYIKFNEDKLKYDEDKISNQLKYDEDRIAKAWDTLTKMAGKKSNGGQINAIQILVKNEVPLDKIDLQDTYLEGANLKGALLRGANMKSVNLTSANLQNADLSGANFDGAYLYGSNLGGTIFDGASFKSTYLAFAKVDIGIILASSLRNADLTGVKFVLEDSEGNSDFQMFGDTIAEHSNADEGQWKINQSCANQKFNEPQDQFIPINLPRRACNYGVNYKNIEHKVYKRSDY